MTLRSKLSFLVLGVGATAFPAFASMDGLNIDEKTGVVVAGAWGERRAYAPLDIAEILPGFLGVWSVTPEKCDAVRSQPNQATSTENGVVILRKDGLVSKSGVLHITRAYVHAPPSIAPRTMEKGKAVLLRARRFQREREMLLLLEPDDKHGAPLAIQMLLSDDGKTLRIGERLPRTEWRRCHPE